jgi:hypothetical protein
MPETKDPRLVSIIDRETALLVPGNEFKMCIRSCLMARPLRVLKTETASKLSRDVMEWSDLQIGGIDPDECSLPSDPP